MKPLKYQCSFWGKYYLTDDSGKWYYYDSTTGEFGIFPFENFKGMEDLFRMD